MGGLGARLADAAQTAWRRTVLSAVGGGMLLIAGAFLSAALWMVCERELGALAAAVLLGSLYLCLGLIPLLMIFASRRSERRARAEEERQERLALTRTAQPSNPYAPLVEAVVIGFDLGVRLRQNRQRRR